jgi:hypothetical protein
MNDDTSRAGILKSGHHWGGGMTNRRQFFGQMTCAVAPLAMGLPTSLLAVDRKPLSFHALLIDAALPAAEFLHNRLAANHAAIHQLKAGDLTDFWLHTLEPLWREQPLPIAGLTHSAALMCLEQLAWPSGLRVVFHAEHVLRVDGSFDHEIHRVAPGQELLTARELQLAGSAWHAPLAATLARFDPRRRAKAQGFSCAGIEPELQTGDQLLTSWIIAPV